MWPAPKQTVDLRTSEDECGDSALKRVRHALETVAPGEILEVRATVAEHVFVVRAWSRKTGRPIVGEEQEGKETRIYVMQKTDA